MLNENAQAWIAALNSNRYSQTSRQLRTAAGFCCLGVACDVLEPEQWVQHNPDPANTDNAIPTPPEYTHNRQSLTLPKSITSQLGMDPNNDVGELICPEELLETLSPNTQQTLQNFRKNYRHDEEPLHTSLIALNDAGVAFTTIAELIAAEPPGFFTTQSIPTIQ